MGRGGGEGRGVTEGEGEGGYLPTGGRSLRCDVLLMKILATRLTFC